MTNDKSSNVHSIGNAIPWLNFLIFPLLIAYTPSSNQFDLAHLIDLVISISGVFISISGFVKSLRKAGSINTLIAMAYFFYAVSYFVWIIVFILPLLYD